MALSDAERQRSYRERRKAGEKLVRYRRPKDRRSRPERWADAVETLRTILDDYEAWHASMPAGVENSATADRIAAVLELREMVDALDDADLPKGFGRD